MRRRDFLKSAGAATAGLALGRPAFADRSPNIVIIMADDLGWGDLGCYGSRSIATPNLDAMAGQGIRLTSFYSSGPVCSPSRAGLLTGRYPVRFGAHHVFFPSANPATPFIHLVYRLAPGMDLDEIIMPAPLKQKGYRTCCVGKWHLGDLPPYRPHRRGFDHYLGLLYSNDMTPLKLYRNDEVIEKHPVDQRFLTGKYTEEAVDWIGRNKDHPFLLYMPHTFPHVPLHASPEFQGRSRGGLYGDCVEELDWSVGEVLKALDEAGLAENTLVFFTSDNGPWYQGSPGGFRGRKSEAFEGGMRVPGIARWPGVIGEGEVSDQACMNIDLFSTALALAGAAPPADRPIDGKNILPLLQGGPTPHEALFMYDGTSLDAVRSQKWKFLPRQVGWAADYYVVPKGPALFDMEIDPRESYNVIDRHPDVVENFQRLIKEHKQTFAR